MKIKNKWFARSFFFDFRIFHRLYFEKCNSFTLHSTRCNTNSSYDSPIALSARLSNSSKVNISSFHLFPAFSSPKSVGYCPYFNWVPSPPRYCKWIYISYSFSPLGFNCSYTHHFLGPSRTVTNGLRIIYMLISASSKHYFSEVYLV